MVDLPLFPKPRKRRRKKALEAPAQPSLEGRLRGRLEEARIEFVEARTRLNALLQDTLGEINSNLSGYAVRNVMREVKKNPKTFQSLSEDQQALFREELKVTLETEVPGIVAQLRGSPEWFDIGTFSFDSKSKVWNTIKSLDPHVNRVMRKYGLEPVNTAGWHWLSESLTKLAEKDFPLAKKIYVEKKKNLEYMENRVEEEATQSQVTETIEDLFSP
ncbi:MAG: hypothetical protein ABIH66_07215 [bacterium]